MNQDNPIGYGRESSASFAALTDAFGAVAQAVVDRLPAFAPYARVVDLACGPGQPGLSVAERYPQVDLLGVDTSPDMLAIARAQAAGRANVRFAATDLEKLDLPSASADVIVSRFGFLALEDISRSAAEFARIARPGCVYSIAVWDRLELKTMASASIESLRGLVDDVLLPPLDELDARAAAALPATALTQAGVTELRTELFSWSTPVGGFEPLQSMLTGPGIWRSAVCSLDSDALTEVRRRYSARLAQHAAPDGTYRIPSTCRLLWGHV